MISIKRLFLTATYFEAKAILSLSNWNRISKNFYRSGSMALLITGIGREKICRILPFLDSFDIQDAVNIGICGGILNFDICSEFSPEQYLTESELQKCNLFSLTTLISLEEPMKNPKEILASTPNLSCCPKLGVDMEAAFLSEYFAKRNVCFKTVKIFSDSGESDFFQNFSDRKKALLEALCDVAKKHLYGVAI